MRRERSSLIDPMADEPSWVDLASPEFAQFDRRMTAAVEALVRRWVVVAATEAVSDQTCPTVSS